VIRTKPAKSSGARTLWSRSHKERVDAAETLADELLGTDLCSVLELPKDRVDDPPGGQLAAGEDPGEHDCAKMSGRPSVERFILCASGSERERLLGVCGAAGTVDQKPGEIRVDQVAPPRSRTRMEDVPTDKTSTRGQDRARGVPHKRGGPIGSCSQSEHRRRQSDMPGLYSGRCASSSCLM
jgi:hypothetical protein